MTIHVSYDHECSACGAFFIPFAPGLACPRCARPAAEAFDFLPQAEASLRFNLREYGRYLPTAWYVGSLGDHVLKLLFVVFDGARTEGKTGTDFAAYLDAKLAGMDWGRQDYLQGHVRDIALRLHSDMKGEH